MHSLLLLSFASCARVHACGAYLLFYHCQAFFCLSLSCSTFFVSVFVSVCVCVCVSVVGHITLCQKLASCARSITIVCSSAAEICCRCSLQVSSLPPGPLLVSSPTRCVVSPMQSWPCAGVSLPVRWRNGQRHIQRSLGCRRACMRDRVFLRPSCSPFRSCAAFFCCCLSSSTL